MLISVPAGRFINSVGKTRCNIEGYRCPTIERFCRVDRKPVSNTGNSCFANPYGQPTGSTELYKICESPSVRVSEGRKWVQMRLIAIFDIETVDVLGQTSKASPQMYFMILQSKEIVMNHVNMLTYMTAGVHISRTYS